MPKLHSNLNRKMLTPGFFNDAPSGPAPQPVGPVKGEQPPEAVASPVDSAALPPFMSFADFPKRYELVMPPQLFENLFVGAPLKQLQKKEYDFTPISWPSIPMPPSPFHLPQPTTFLRIIFGLLRVIIWNF